jgi:hypothetical protein
MSDNNGGAIDGPLRVLKSATADFFFFQESLELNPLL